PNGKPLEVQVRTHEMHYQAEYGVAAHWRYKETKGKHTGGQAEVDQMAWMRQLLDWQKEASDPNEFLDTLRRDLSSKQIF
ncbi:GTP diphosphokinase, partial [Escherichia coli]|nr:GTP diphosphokinase [Escherichia coli]